MKTASWTYLLPKLPRAAGTMAPLKLPLWQGKEFYKTRLTSCPTWTSLVVEEGLSTREVQEVAGEDLVVGEEQEEGVGVPVDHQLLHLLLRVPILLHQVVRRALEVMVGLKLMLGMVPLVVLVLLGGMVHLALMTTRSVHQGVGHQGTSGEGTPGSWALMRQFTTLRTKWRIRRLSYRLSETSR